MTLKPLERLATLIAIETPKRRSAHCPTCYVRWDIIDEIRGELEKLGIDWRAMHDHAKRLEQERRAEANR